MILYKQQPQGVVEGGVKNRFFDITQKTEILESIVGKFASHGQTLRYRDATALITDAAAIDAMLSVGGYENILVVTSFTKLDYPKLLVNNIPVKSAGDHLLPIIHKLNESIGNLYVTNIRSAEDIFTKLYKDYEVPNVLVDGLVKLDSVDFKTKTTVKFDAVVLLGCDGLTKGNFGANQVKEKFIPYCTKDFDLVVVDRAHVASVDGKLIEYNGAKFPTEGAYLNTSRKDMRVVYKSPRKITGVMKSTALEFDKMRSIILNINMQRNKMIESDRGYERLFQNIDLIESNLIYRIY